MASEKMFEFKLIEGTLGKDKGDKPSNFIPFEAKSSKLDLSTAMYGKIHKKILSLASKVEQDKLSDLAGASIIVTVEVFKPKEIKAEDIKNNVF